MFLNSFLKFDNCNQTLETFKNSQNTQQLQQLAYSTFLKFIQQLKNKQKNIFNYNVIKFIKLQNLKVLRLELYLKIFTIEFHLK